MSKKRLELDAILRNILGSSNVYFQSPPTIGMKYPCILYERSNMYTNYADNIPYLLEDRYLITVIDQDPDSEIPRKIAMMEKAKFDRHYVANNLNHDVIEIYF